MVATVVPSTVDALADEVGDLLRHDNLDSRIDQWLAMTFVDMTTRLSTWRFARFEAINFTDTNFGSTLSTPKLIGDVLGFYVIDANSKWYFPRYVSYNDWKNFMYDREGTATTAVVGTPLLWTFSPARDNIYIYPSSNGASVGYIHYMSTDILGEISDGTQCFKLPYHWEHCLVWGAASIGIKSLRPHLYPLFLGEYEQALENLQHIVTYRPDSVPTLRSVTGVYGGTPKMQVPPRLPRTING